MRVKAGVAAVVAAGTTFVCVAPASAQEVEPTCSDFPTQIDMENSIFPPTLDASVFDPDADGVGCEENPAPPVAYNAVVVPPARVNDVPPQPLEVSPTSGPPGTVITVHGESCVHFVLVNVALRLFNDTTQQNVATRNIAGHPPEVEIGGSWTGQLTVPAGVDPNDAFTVVADCSVLDPERPTPPILRYEPVAFDVTGTPAPPPAPATPAKPVVAQPTFTG
jgi:hypothetical protein